MTIHQPNVQTTATENNRMRTTLLCSATVWWNSVLQALLMSALHIQYDEAVVTSVRVDPKTPKFTPFFLQWHRKRSLTVIQPENGISGKFKRTWTAQTGTSILFSAKSDILELSEHVDVNPVHQLLYFAFPLLHYHMLLPGDSFKDTRRGTEWWDHLSLTNVFKGQLHHALIKNLHMRLGLHKVAIKEAVKQLICFSSMEVVFRVAGQALGSESWKKGGYGGNSPSELWDPLCHFTEASIFSGWWWACQLSLLCVFHWIKSLYTLAPPW